MDKPLYKTNRHSCYLLEYHLVVVTKYRHPVLVGRIKERLTGLTQYIIEECWGCEIHEVNMDKDHIHILFEAKPQVQLSKLVNNYKTVTSRHLRKEFAEELKPYYWKPYFWSDSYFICSVSDRTHAVIAAYIKSQGR
ncbi:IS200/IS605 family transposase [Eubacterium sp. An3]|uniref:IS200/IS605 family transposase n=1 Tax=Eubacterium sp. An3 TaxID=1965628 RepID=UPI000B3ABE66|nr:IS200/IS605 family transposase [Eubacterium sp. An3]OUO26535.1 IS200/IS605 family transposase [Eubacterium sp. An3]